MQYLGEEDLSDIVTIIQSYDYGGEPAPDYDREQNGIEHTLSLFERIQQSFYKGIFHKAAHLFVTLDKSHYFSSGNKRIALISCAQFLHKNGYIPRRRQATTYQNRIGELFPDGKHTLEQTDPSDFESIHEFGFYTITLIVADSKRDRGELVKATELFLQNFFKLIS